MAIKVGMISLGCAKNQVDGEILMGTLQEAGFELSRDAALADVAIVNTCGFIESAKKESIDEILELAALKREGRIKRLIVTGCLSERYKEQVRQQMPEIDAALGIGANAEIAEIVRAVMEGENSEIFPPKEDVPMCGSRHLSTPSHFAYLKVAEGCDNRCTYCAIPLIRGGFRSRPIKSIMEEAAVLAKNGVKEIALIAQDTTRYGMDIFGEPSLSRLLRELCTIDGIKWIRVLYCYPDTITDELLDVMAGEEKIVKYIDIPLQHASEDILKAMNRRGNRQQLETLLAKIRDKIPGVALRTTFITGFPGEREQDFQHLAEFIKSMRFDRMGCFCYSREEDTPAAGFENQIDEATKNERAQILAQAQMEISESLGRERIGRVFEVVTEGFDEYLGHWFGRSYMEAPDVDPRIFFTAPEDGKEPDQGEFVYVKICDCIDGDLYGKIIQR